MARGKLRKTINGIVSRNTERWRSRLKYRAIIAQALWMQRSSGSTMRYGDIMKKWEVWAERTFRPKWLERKKIKKNVYVVLAG